MISSTVFLGGAATILASFLWAIAVIIFKKYDDRYSPLFINFVKTLVGFIFVAGIVLISGIPVVYDPQFIFWMSVSGITGLSIGDSAMISSIQRLGAFASSILMLLIAPFAALFGYVFLGETLQAIQCIGMAITITAVGVALSLNRSGSGFFSGISSINLRAGLIAAFVAIFCQVFSTIAARFVMQDQNVWLGTAIKIFAALIFLGPFFFRNLYQKRNYEVFKIQPSLCWILFACFIGGALGLVLLTTGHKYVKAGISTSLASMTPLWIIPLSSIFLGEKLKLQTIILTIIAFIGIFFIF